MIWDTKGRETIGIKIIEIIDRIDRILNQKLGKDPSQDLNRTNTVGKKGIIIIIMNETLIIRPVEMQEMIETIVDTPDPALKIEKMMSNSEMKRKSRISDWRLETTRLHMT